MSPRGPDARASTAHPEPVAVESTKLPVDADTLRRWVERVLVAVDYTAADAAFLAETLLDANLRGIDSHGVMRLPVYVQRIQAGLVDPRALPTVRTEGAVAHVEANGAAGQLASRAALEAVVTIAEEHGVGCAVVRGSAHFGTAGFYARWLAARSCLGLVVSNSESIVVPHGSSEAVLGTNPIAFAAPRGDRPLSLDMATSASAMGKVMVAADRGAVIPEGWGVDRSGRPTTDPAALHALLPLGGPKGYGLGVLVEVLAGVLSGAAIASDIGNMYRDLDRRQDVGHFVLALHLPHFLARDAFATRLEHLASLLTSARPAPGFDQVMLPGEPEERMRDERRRDGIPLDPATHAHLERLGAALSVPFPTPTGPSASRSDG
jgi:ureidoglycolate dehydrogenase (NAD+)